MRREVLTLACVVGIIFPLSGFTENVGEMNSADVAREKISEATQTGNYNGLRLYLKSSPEAERAEIEELVVSEARSRFDAGEYDIASNLVESVLQNNLDNDGAQSLLIEIQDTLKRLADEEAMQRELRAEAERKEAERLAAAKAEAERLAAAKAEAERLAAAKAEAERLVAAKAAAERAERERLASKQAARRERLKGLGVYAFLSPVALDVSSSDFRAEYAGSGIQARYGAALGASVRYSHPFANLIACVAYENLPLPLSGEDRRHGLLLRVSYGYPGIEFPLYAHIGYRYFSYYDPGDENTTAVVFSTVNCPTVGIGVERFPVMPGFDLSARLSWLPLSFVDSLITFAFDFDVEGRYRLPRLLGKYDLFVSAGSLTTVIVASGGNEILETLRIGAGVSLND